MMFKEELEGRKILVTGANGFVGSHLVDKLVEHGADVVAFVESGTKPDNLQRSINDIEVVYGDLRDFRSVYQCVKKLKGFEDVLIFHLELKPMLENHGNVLTKQLRPMS